MKRFVSILVALLLVLTMVPAMANAEGEIKRQENGLPDFEGRVFTIWYQNRNPGYGDDLGEKAVVKKLEEMLNCDIQFIHPPQGQESEHFAITMAEDKLPDIINCGAIDSYYPGGLAMAYEDGILYDYTELINETNTPNFCEVMLGDDYLAPLMKDDEGRIVRLGAKIQGSAEANYWYEGLTIRQDLLAATGKEVPVTIADWYEVLSAMKANGVEYPLGANKDYMLKYFAMAYGIVHDDYYLGEDGAVHYGPYEAAYKDYLAEMNKWYTEGLINADFMTTTSGDMTAMMLDGKVGATPAHVWEWPYSYNVNNTNPEAALVAAPYPKLNADDEMNLRHSSRNMDDFKYITADAEDPLACVMFLDCLYIPEISYMMGNGIKGYDWEYDKNGLPESIVWEKDENGNRTKGYLKSDPENIFTWGDEYAADTPDVGAISEWHMYEDCWDSALEAKWTPVAAEGIRMWGEAGTEARIPGSGRFLMYTAEEAEIRSEKKADVETYVDEMHLKFITGQEPIENFDAYIEQLKAMGVEDLITVTQAAYERLQARR